MASEEESEKQAPPDPLQDHSATSNAPKDAAGNFVGEGPFYVNIAPFVLPVIGEKGPEQLISLVITLEVVDGKAAAIIKQRLPRLNDAYLQTLYGALDQKLVNKGQLVDIGLVKQRLRAPTERILGPDVAKDILVQAVAQRKL